MNLKAYPYEDVAVPLMGRRRGLLGGRRLLKGAGRGKGSMMRVRKSRSFFCCCPVFFALGVAGLGAIGGLFYVGIRFLGWA